MSGLPTLPWDRTAFTVMAVAADFHCAFPACIMRVGFFGSLYHASIL